MALSSPEQNPKQQGSRVSKSMLQPMAEPHQDLCNLGPEPGWPELKTPWPPVRTADAGLASAGNL